jgi:hypothetical protein
MWLKPNLTIAYTNRLKKLSDSNMEAPLIPLGYNNAAVFFPQFAYGFRKQFDCWAIFNFKFFLQFGFPENPCISNVESGAV